MRELAVFYCPKCGHYAYYQTSRHPNCPKCDIPSHLARIHYSQFMQMSYEERDEFLSQEILSSNPSLMKRLTFPSKKYNSREIIAEMNMVIMQLDTENKVLSDTVKWMHDTVWELMREKKYGSGNGSTGNDSSGSDNNGSDSNGSDSSGDDGCRSGSSCQEAAVTEEPS